jgi:DNA polymerase-1
MNKLLLIDGNAILHRAYYALPPLTTNDGTQINAVYGFVSMLLRVVENLKPTHIAVAWDTPKATFRHVQYSNYQANRPRTQSELEPQFAIAHKVLEAMQIPIYFQEGFEADDVLGTITAQVPTDNEVIIVTGDRDILQLVDDAKHHFVYMPIRGLSDAKLYREADVVKRMGVKPTQIIDFKALVGDPSDNYPGVAGIGPKTATGLLEKFGTLEALYENLWQVPDNTASKLAKGAEAAGISKKLATIVTDVPITFHLEEAKRWQIGGPKVVALFKEIGFRTLTNRVQNFKQNSA